MVKRQGMWVFAPEVKEWLGDFNPDSFNISQANQAIALTCALYNVRKWGAHKWGFRKIYDFAGL